MDRDLHTIIPLRCGGIEGRTNSVSASWCGTVDLGILHSAGTTCRWIWFTTISFGVSIMKFSGLAALVLSVLLCLLLLESHRTTVQGLHDRRAQWSLFAWRGTVYLIEERFPPSLFPPQGRSRWVGVEIWSRDGPDSSVIIASVPIGPLLLLTTGWVVFVWAFPIFKRRYRMRRHLCANCGYPLVRLPTNRCPECGTWSAGIRTEDGKQDGKGGRAKKPGKEDANEMSR